MTTHTNSTHSISITQSLAGDVPAGIVSCSPCFLLCWEVEPHITSQKAAPRSLQAGQAGSRVASVPHIPGQGLSPQVPVCQPSRGVLCSPGTAGSQVTARTLLNTPQKLGINEAVHWGTCCSSHPLRVCGPAAVRGVVPLPTAAGHSHLPPLSHCQQHLAGQESLSIQTFFPTPLPEFWEYVVFPRYSSNISLLLLSNIIFIILY